MKEFAMEYPYMVFVMYLFAVFLAFGILSTAKFTWNRLLRSLNLKNNGWPPPHCDADGDIIHPPKQDEE